MKRLRLLPLTLTLLVLVCAVPALHAQYSLGLYPCGPANTKLVSCNGVPVSIDGVLKGTIWINDQLSPTSVSPSFIIWQAGVEWMPQSSIGKSVCVTTATFTSGNQTAQQCTFLVVYFHGGDVADRTYYTGEGTFHFDYNYAGSGISAGWKRKLTAGAITVAD